MLSPIQSMMSAYSPLSEACQSDLEKIVEVKAYPKNEILVKEGELSNRLFFILEGSMRAYYNKDGRIVTDWFAFENDFICAIVSFFMHVPSPHFIEILEPCKLVEIKRDDVELLCDKHHDFDRLARLSVTKTMLQLQQRVVSLQFENAQQRLENLLSVFPTIMERVPLGDIASFIGMTQETLSRLRAART